MKFLNWISKLLSGTDDGVSSTRFIGLTAFVFLLWISKYSIQNNVESELLKVVLEYLFYIMCATLFIKSVEKIVKLIVALRGKKEE